MGSSPLARGLPQGLLELLGDRRIIPARAGFTQRALFMTITQKDHPRSRGVYARPSQNVAVAYGSSPLARGLRSRLLTRLSASGIIPARAGFTAFSKAPSAAAADHPRSRGVYAFVERSHMWEWGSSPLARGLQLVPKRVPGGTGIIPARAGFTGNFSLLRLQSGDHPRSRGVYTVACTSSLHEPGSSPLARGLLARPRVS